MRENFKKIYKNPMLFVFIIILIFYTPLAIYSPGESRNRGVVTAVGIDKIDDMYEVSLLTFIPTANQNFEEQKSIISAKGETVVDAIYNAQIAMGRKIGLFHAKTTVVNEALLEEDVAQHLDYLCRVASLPENTVFVSTNKTAKELFQLSQQSKSNIGLKLEQIVGFNADNIYVTDTSLEAFYKGYYSHVKASIIGYLCIEDENDPNAMASVEKAELGSEAGSSLNPQETSQQAGQSTENNSNSTQGKQTLVNCGKSILLKDGKKVEILSVDTLNAINLLNEGSKNQIIRIFDVDKNGQKINMSYQIKSKNVLTTTKFVNGNPVLSAKVKLGLELVEVEGDHNKLKINTEYSEINEEIANKIDAEIKKQFTSAIDLLKKNSADVIGLNKTFYRSDRKNYEKFIKNIAPTEDFIKHVTFKLNLSVEPD